MKGICVAGSLLVDKINVVSSYPKLGELIKISKVEKSLGGLVGNVGIDLKKLSRDLPVYAVSKIGNDDNGKFIEEELKNQGLDTSGLKKSDEITTFTEVVSVLEGGRTFLTYPGSNSSFSFEDVDFERLKCRILHLGYFLLLEKVDNGEGLKILKKAKEMGIKTSIDLVSEDSNRYSKVLPCLKYVDYVIINEVEAGGLTGIEPKFENMEKIARAIMEFGVKEKVIIHAPEYAVSLSENGFSYLPSLQIENSFIKGTTGAGDAFCAGALLSIYNEKSDMEILDIASKCAAMSLTSHDATGGMCSVEEVLEFFKDYKRRDLC